MAALGSLLTIVAVSPAGLWQIRNITEDWPLLSSIGQAYGGISAVLSSLALIAVGATLIVQLRQHRLEQIATIRSFQFSLYDLIRQDPATYGPVLGFPDEESEDSRRRTAYVQAFQYLAASFEVGLIDETILTTEALPGIFKYRTAHIYWRGAREAWLADRASRRRRRFTTITDEFWKKSVEPRPSDRPQADEKGRPTLDLRLTIFLVGAASGALATWAVRRPKGTTSQPRRG